MKWVPGAGCQVPVSGSGFRVPGSGFLVFWGFWLVVTIVVKA
jgi:hypothetical protein